MRWFFHYQKRLAQRRLSEATNQAVIRRSTFFRQANEGFLHQTREAGGGTAGRSPARPLFFFRCDSRSAAEANQKTKTQGCL